MRRAGTKRGCLDRLAGVLGGILIGLVIAEVFLRVIGFSHPNFYEYSDLTGAQLRAGASGWYQKEGKAYIQISSQGLRDQEHTRDKPTDVVRIAVLGDSFTEALQLPLEETFCSVMEQSLRDSGASSWSSVEVLNFGVSGFGTAQELLTLRDRVFQYHPDIVILAFYTGNDISNNSVLLESNQLRPFFVTRGDSLVLDGSFITEPLYRWKTGWLWSLRRGFSRHFRIGQLLDRAKEALASANAPKDIESLMEHPSLVSEVYRCEPDERWQEAWEVTERLIVTARDEIEAQGARFYVVVLSTAIQVHPDYEIRETFKALHGFQNLLCPDERIRALGEREGLDVILLAPLLREYAQENDTFFHGFDGGIPGFGHWNAEAHRLAGSVIAERLIRDAEQVQNSIK